jgi:MATE family multidrug resistance protein
VTDPIPISAAKSESEVGMLRQLLRLGIPLVAGMGGHALFNIVDLAMVGAWRGGPDKPTEATLSAVGIASLVTTAPIVFMNGISNGSVTVIARAYGGRKHRRTNEFARQALVLAAVLSVLLGVLPGIFSGPIATAFGAKVPGSWERVLTRDFLALMSFNAWSAFVLMQVTANMRAIGMAGWTLVLMLFSNVGNVVGNWLLVFGNLGMPEMGPIGSAWATVIARGIAAIGGILVLAQSDPAIRISWKGWIPRWRFMWGVLRAGLPVALQWTVRMIAITLVMLVIAQRLDADQDVAVREKAAFSVGTRLDTLALFAGLGWGAACAALVSHGIGRGAFGLVRRIARDSAVLNVVMMSLAGALYFLFARELVQLFSLHGDATETSPAVLDAGVRYLRISVCSYPALALCVVWAHAMNGVGSLKTPLLLDTVGLLLVQVPLVWWMSGTQMGVRGAWWALVLSHSLLAVAYWMVFRFGSWETKKRR